MNALVGRSRKDGEWLWSVEHEALEKADRIAHERRLEVERGITYAELIEECAGFSEPQQALFMSVFRAWMAEDMNACGVLMFQAFQRVVQRKLQGE